MMIAVIHERSPPLLHVRLLSSPQARDEVITVLKADKLDVALLEAKYGFVTPQKVLQALQRDAIQGKADVFQEDIYEKPMEEVTPARHNGTVPPGHWSGDRGLNTPPP